VGLREMEITAVSDQGGMCSSVRTSDRCASQSPDSTATLIDLQQAGVGSVGSRWQPLQLRTRLLLGSRAALSHALGLSSSPMGMSMPRQARSLGQFFSRPGSSITSTDVVREVRSHLDLETDPSCATSIDACREHRTASQSRYEKSRS
jgi:hypothetical protein